MTKKQIQDNIINILTKFQLSDDSRFAYISRNLSYMIDQCRETLIVAQFRTTKVIDRAWLTDLGLVDFHQVNFADDPHVTYCNCDISKTFIPPVISLYGAAGNIDLGLYSMLSSCGTTEYYPFPMSVWRRIPSEHIRSKFNYYDRKNTELYVNKKIEQLLITAVLQNPADGYIISSNPIASGNLTAGTVYLVKFNSIVYNGIVYLKNTTFTGVTGVTTYTGAGKVVLNSQYVALDENEPYPCTGDMARLITFEILTKEFGIEEKELTDLENDSADEQTKPQVA